MTFLDDPIADFSRPGMHELLEIFIRAYDVEYEALALAGQVGLLRADIAIHPKLRFTWRSILEEAATEGQLRRLVDHALQDGEIAAWHTRIRSAIGIPAGRVAAPEARTTDGTPDGGPKPTVGDRAALWDPGSTVTVRFLDGSARLRARVEKAATEWTKYANLHFEFGDDPDAHVRVTFRNPGNWWSFVGRQSLEVPPGEPTMSLLDDHSDQKHLRLSVLQAFGHVLGLRHEHGNPTSTLRWNRPAVYKFFAGPPNYWTRAEVDHKIFAIWPPSHYPVQKIFDRRSIMMFPMPAEYFVSGQAIGLNERLSPLDKQFAAALYPIREGR